MTNSESLHTIVFHAISIITFEKFLNLINIFFNLVGFTWVCSLSSLGWASEGRGSVTPAVPVCVSTLAFITFTSLLLGWQVFNITGTFSTLLLPYKYAIICTFRLANNSLIYLFYWLIFYLLFCCFAILLGYEPEGYNFQDYWFLCLLTISYTNIRYCTSYLSASTRHL